MDYRDHYYRDAIEFEKKRQTWKKSFVKNFSFQLSRWKISLRIEEV